MHDDTDDSDDEAEEVTSSLMGINAYLHPICEIQVQIRRCLYPRGLQGDQVNGKGYNAMGLFC